MPATARIVIIADFHGRVLAAELPNEVKAASTEKGPMGHLLPLEGQRTVTVDVPREVLKLTGPDLHRFFSEVKIHSDGKVQVPKIKASRMKRD